MAVQFYDDKMLGDNFSAINKFNGDVLDILEGLTTIAERNDARLKTLENIQLVIKAPKRSKLFLIALAGAGVYAGYKYAEREFRKDRMIADWSNKAYAEEKHTNTTNNPEQ